MNPQLLRAGLLLAAAMAAGPMPAAAHNLSRSYSLWNVGEAGEVKMVFSIAPGQISGLREPISTHLQRRLALQIDGRPCVPQTPAPAIRAPAGGGPLRAEWFWRCPQPSPQSRIRLHSDAIFDQLGSHLHFARILYRNDGRETLLTAYARSFEGPLDPKAAAPGGGLAEILGRYIWIGIVHIAIGLDHLAFLAALLLVCGSARPVLIAVTGFTLGHSATLALAALGIVTANTAIVEALIGFTILLVAAESTGLRPLIPVLTAVLATLALFSWWTGGLIGPVGWAGLILLTLCYAALCPDPRTARRATPALATLFGLIHGLGFAAVLAETGLPPGQALPALAGFNIGVEVGQILFVVLFFTLGLAASKLFASRAALAPAQPFLPVVTAAALAGLGAYWLAARTLV